MAESTRRGLRALHNIDYTVIFARDLAAMRKFYRDTLGFQVYRELGDGWTEFRIGGTILALSQRNARFDDAPPPQGALSLQLAFRVTPSQVDECAEDLQRAGVRLVEGPTDQPFGHRTLFFRDPDGNVLEIYAEI